MHNSTSEAEEKLREVTARAYAGSTTEAIRNSLHLVLLLTDVAEKQTPAVLEFGSLEVTNAAYREAISRSNDDPSCYTEEPETEVTLLKRAYNSLELKPGLFGVKVDVRKLLKLPDKL